MAVKRTPQTRLIANRVAFAGTARTQNPGSLPNIPKWVAMPPSTAANPALLNRAGRSVSESQRMIAGANTFVPVIFGTKRIGARCPTWIVRGNTLHILCVWGRGECDAIEALELEDGELPAGITYTHYLGTAGQGVDPWLQAAFADAGKAYTQTLPNVCYSSVKITGAAVDGIPNLVARVRGLKVRASELATRAFSDNGAYHIAELITSTTIGLGEAVNWTDVAAVAAANIATVGGEPKRQLNVALDTPLPVEDWIAALADYCACWVFKEGSTWRMIPDAPGAPTRTLTVANIASIAQFVPRSTRNDPTVIRVKYTDTTSRPWQEATATYYAPGVLAGTTPRRVSEISRLGIHRYSEAYRYAIERYNDSALCDLSIPGITVYDEGVKDQVGDLIALTFAPYGMAAKPFRILGVTAPEAGSWTLALREYDPAKFSSVVVSVPTVVDTTLPSPSAPPAMSALTGTEETYQTDTGIFASRIRVTWTEPTWPFIAAYRVTVKVGATEVHTGTAQPGAAVYVTPAMQEGNAYTIEVAVLSSSGAIGAASSTMVTTAGKALAPGNVLAVAGLEAGGRVFLSWSAADNPTHPGTPDPDVWGYEIRRGATTDAWAAAKVIDRRDTLTMVDEGAPVGTWRYHVKALDSVGQYSATAATCDVTVTSDAASFSADVKYHTAPTLTNMASYTLAPDDASVYYVTEDGVAWNTKFSSTLNAYANALATYHNSVTSTWLGEAEDFAQIMSGQWTGVANAVALSGALISYLGYSTDGSSYSYAVGLSQKLTARFARMKHEALTTATLKVTVPTQSILASIVPRRESFAAVTTLASGGKSVQLAGAYSVAKTVQLTPLGSTFAIAVADRVLVSPEAGLMLAFDLSGSGSVFQLFNNASGLPRLLVTGDYLEFDVRASPANPNLAATFGIYATYTDASNSGHYSTASAGVWTAIKTALAVGKTMNGVNFAGSSSVAGAYACQIRNVRITDGAGTTRATLWASGEPAQNSTTSSTAATNIRMGPANAFLAYAFNAAGSQIARDVSVIFEGS